MAVNEEDPDKVVRKLVTRIATLVSDDRTPDVKLFKLLKSKCKENRNNELAITYEQLAIVEMEKNNADIRLTAFRMIGALFERSHQFRLLVVGNLEQLSELAIGTNPSKPLPLPKKSAQVLQNEAILCFDAWMKKFESGYPVLKIAREVLSKKIDFQRQRLVGDISSLAAEREEERLRILRRSRCSQVEQENAEKEPDLNRCLREVDNSLSLWQQAKTGDAQSIKDHPVFQSLCDEHRELTKRYLPMTKRWVDTLTKAGRQTNHQLLSRCVQLLRRIETAAKNLKELGLDAVLAASETSLPCDEVKSPTKSVSDADDPTSWAATLARLKPEMAARALPSKAGTDLFDQPGSSKTEPVSPVKVKGSNSHLSQEAPAPSSSKSSIPKINLSGIMVPQTVHMDTESTSVWLSHSGRDGSSLTVGDGVQRIIEFSGEFEPVQWTCRAPMPSGGLCPRQDRRRCPFHGPIVERDDSGNVIEASSSTSVDPAPPKRPDSSKVTVKRKVTKSKLASNHKEVDTSRTRLTKKVFNKSAQKRIANALNKYDAIRTKDKFGDQFNYQM